MQAPKLNYHRSRACISEFRFCTLNSVTSSVCLLLHHAQAQVPENPEKCCRDDTIHQVNNFVIKHTFVKSM